MELVKDFLFYNNWSSIVVKIFKDIDYIEIRLSESHKLMGNYYEGEIYFDSEVILKLDMHRFIYAEYGSFVSETEFVRRRLSAFLKEEHLNEILKVVWELI